MIPPRPDHLPAITHIRKAKTRVDRRIRSLMTNDDSNPGRTTLCGADPTGYDAAFTDVRRRNGLCWVTCAACLRVALLGVSK